MNPGHSFLADEIQAKVELALCNGRTLSGVARDFGVSRDQARTIQRRMLRAGWHAEQDRLENRLAALEAAVTRLEAGWPQRCSTTASDGSSPSPGGSSRRPG